MPFRAFSTVYYHDILSKNEYIPMKKCKYTKFHRLSTHTSSKEQKEISYKYMPKYKYVWLSGLSDKLFGDYRFSGPWCVRWGCGEIIMKGENKNNFFRVSEN